MQASQCAVRMVIAPNLTSSSTERSIVERESQRLVMRLRRQAYELEQAEDAATLCDKGIRV